MIHMANPQSQPVVITVFTYVVRPSVPAKLLKLNFARLPDMLVEWIIDDFCLVFVDLQG